MATVVPQWVVTTEEIRARLQAWAQERALYYQPTGLLPPISAFTTAGFGIGWQIAHVQHGRGALITYKGGELRPERFSENLCTGALPGGVEGTLCHHTHLWRRPSGRDSGTPFAAVGDTVVAAWVPEGARLTRGLAGMPVKSRRKKITINQPEYGPADKQPDLVPALRERIWWEVDADEDTEPLAPVFDREVVSALQAAPELTRISLRDGWLTVEHPEYQDDPALLDALCGVASVLAAAVRRAATLQPRLEPGGGALPEPPDTPFQRYLRDGAARVDWTQPPPDVRTSIERYLNTSGKNWRTRRVSVDQATGWGREAFAREYARARGLRVEDAEQVRRRIAVPFPGRPERSMYGRLAGAVEGRLVHWRDRAHPQSGNRAMNLALIAAPAGALPSAREPYGVLRADNWLVVAEDLGTGDRTAAALDALCAEAARLASG